MKYKGITIHPNNKCSTWYTRYRRNNKQYYISAKTQAECLQMLKKQLNTKNDTEQIKEYSFIEWYREWYKLFKENVKEETTRDYNNCIKHLGNNFANKKISTITTIQISEILNKIKSQRIKQKVYELLKMIFDKAKIYKIINGNPIELIDRPKYKRDRGTILTKEQYTKLVSECQKEKKLYAILLILWQGLRIGECLAICKNDIDITNKTICINKSWNKKREFDTTKNTQSNRTIPLFKNSIELLNKIDTNNKQRIFEYSQRQLRIYFDAIREKCQIQRAFRIHDLRHTFITYCKDNNVPEHIVQNWVGHEIGSNVTRKIYTHINNDTNNTYIDLINERNSTQILLTKNND